MTLKKGWNPKQKTYKIFLKKGTKYLARSFIHEFGYPEHMNKKLKITRYKRQPEHPGGWKLYKIKVLN